MGRRLIGILVMTALLAATCPAGVRGAGGDTAELNEVSVSQLVEDPVRPGRVYAATDQGVFLLPDQNGPWKDAASGLTGVSVSSIVCAPDGSLVVAATDEGLWQLPEGSESWSLVSGSPQSAICLSLADANTAWRLMAVSGTSAYLSRIGVQGFAPVGMGLPQTGITCCATDPWDPSVLYVGTVSGLYVSRNAGGAWIRTLEAGIRVLQPDNAFEGALRVGGSGCIFISTDQGATWTTHNAGLPDASVTDIEVDPASPGIRYATVEGYGLWRSVDDARHWSDNSGGLDSSDLTCILRLSGRASFFYVGSTEGVQSFSDTPAQSDRLEAPLELQSTSLLVHDATAKRLFAATIGDGVWVSIDDGGSWKRCGADFAPSEVTSLLVDPNDSARLLAGTAGGLYASADNGTTWGPSAGGLSEVTVRCLAFSPGHADTLYAGTDGIGLQVSVDAGATWSRMRNGITGDFVSDVSPNPADPSDILVLVNKVGVFRSTNSGARFVVANDGVGNPLVRQLARDPLNPMRVYLTTAAVTKPGGQIVTPAAVYISVNGGSTWTSPSKGLGPDTILSLVAGKADMGVLYLGQENNGLLMSSDKGLTWEDISPGLTSEGSQLNAFSLVEGVRGKRTLLVATALSGIFACRFIDFNPVSNLILTATLDGKPITCGVDAVLGGGSPRRVSGLPSGPEQIMPGTWRVRVLSGGPQNARRASGEADVRGVLQAGQTLTLNIAWETLLPPPPQPRGVVLVLRIGSLMMIRDGTSVSIDVPPQIVQGRTLLPIKWVAEPLGASVAWDPVERKVTVVLDMTTLELWIGKSTARVNGSSVAIDPQNAAVVPLIVSGRTMLPVRFVAEQLGAKVEYDAVGRSVTITWPAP